MNLSYRKVFSDNNNIEYYVVKSNQTLCLAMQGKRTDFNKIKKAFLSNQKFYQSSSENFFKPISLNDEANNSFVSALFEYEDCGKLTDFLKNAPLEWQYSTGKKIGRILKAIHSIQLNQKEQNKAKLRHNKFMEHMAQYITQLPHFKNDKFAIDAISSRYDHFKLYRGVFRYGSLKHQKIMLKKDGTLLLLPSYTSGVGDVCEDFASLECESGGLYPYLCAGAIDGYFSGVVPTKFWMHFALYCALYSLWKCAKVVKNSPNMMINMQQNSDRIRDDFKNYTSPIPVWYSSKELVTIRNNCIKQGL